MEQALLWYLSSQAISLAFLPIAGRVFRWLPDRGYSFSKPLSLLLAAYALWLGGSLGILENSRQTIAAILIVGTIVSWGLIGARDSSWRDWWRARFRYVIVVEVLFAVALAAMAVLRAYDASIAYTEKPMELAFLNALGRSDAFPPQDPWLSGNSISYYYFGYLMMSLVGKVAGVGSANSFNLATALLFAFTVVGSFGVIYNIIALSLARAGARWKARPYVFGLIGSGLVCILANLEGLIEFLNYRGLLSLGFKDWLGIKDLPAVVTAGTGWFPVDDWWWFRASRVIGQFNATTGVSSDYTINEFPFFSFLLGDLHPHVLALPFVVLCVGLALNVFFRARSDSDLRFGTQPLLMVVTALAIGALGFLNTWDMPTLGALVVVAFVATEIWRAGALNWGVCGRVLLFALRVGLVGILLYLPFYLFLSSQAKGIAPVLVRTEWQQFMVFWAPFLVILCGFLILKLLALADSLRESGVEGVEVTRLIRRFQVGFLVIPVSVFLWLVGFEVVSILLPLIASALVLIWSMLVAPRLARTVAEGDETMLVPVEKKTLPPPLVFVFILAGIGFCLVAIPEMLFLVDLFGNRMNTVFKVYYQAWVLLGLASSASLFYLFTGAIRGPKLVARAVRTATLCVAIVVVVGSLYYPLASSFSKSGNFTHAPEVDGLAYLKRDLPREYEAMTWLQGSVSGTPVVLQAWGQSYTQYSLVSTVTGLPTVLGWDFHEYQWRGSYDEVSRRKEDVDTIYRTDDLAVARRLLERYQVEYVYVGVKERERYGQDAASGLAKFSKLGPVVFKNAGVTIYRVDGSQSLAWGG